MRRKDREVSDIAGKEEIIKMCKTCYTAMVDGNNPYVIPLSFGYEIEGEVLTLYFHSAKEGKKLDILHQNSSVCFTMALEGEAINAEKTPCKSGYYYSSIVGKGNVEFVNDSEEKCKALTLLMKHQANLDITFQPAQAESVCVFKVVTAEFSGKRKSKVLT